ncbi:hypothetical protein [Klebsiella variicola]
MTERGMIFNAEMVRAILDGRNTQTRRPIKWKQTRFTEIGEREDGSKWPWSEDAEHACDFWHPCPFGAVGDRIWVRETFSALEPGSYEQVKAQEWHCQDLRYAATDRLAKSDADIRGYKWVPSIHMPRWASRILLEITDVRVERLKSISDGDAIREGCSTADMKSGDCVADVFARLWASIYGAESWNANPWVWVIEFKRVEGGAA